jgi:hypothetical protein
LAGKTLYYGVAKDAKVAKEEWAQRVAKDTKGAKDSYICKTAKTTPRAAYRKYLGIRVD